MAWPNPVLVEPRENKRTERDTEGMGWDMSIPLKLFIGWLELACEQALGLGSILFYCGRPTPLIRMATGS